MIQNNIVVNVCIWNGDTSIWTPPADTIMLVQDTTPSVVWVAVKENGKIVDYVLSETIGEADIGFTYNGTVCTTNQPKPTI